MNNTVLRAAIEELDRELCAISSTLEIDEHSGTSYLMDSIGAQVRAHMNRHPEVVSNTVSSVRAMLNRAAGLDMPLPEQPYDDTWESTYHDLRAFHYVVQDLLQRAMSAVQVGFVEGGWQLASAACAYLHLYLDAMLTLIEFRETHWRLTEQCQDAALVR